MDIEFEYIQPWNGANDTGRDVRLKWQRNFDKIKQNFSETETSINNLIAQLYAAFTLHYDDPDDAHHLTSIEANAGLWTESYLSALGQNPEAGGGGSTGGGLAGIKVNNQTYSPDAEGYITLPDYPTSLDWESIEGKPTTLEEYGITGNDLLQALKEVDGAFSGLDADLLDGLHSADFCRYAVAQSGVNLNNMTGGGILAVTQSQITQSGANFPERMAGTLFYGRSAYSVTNQIYATYQGNWYMRSGGTGNFTPWKQVAFTDSTVDAANRLANARTLWGQSFDGRNNVSGSLSGVKDIDMSGGLTITGDGLVRMNVQYLGLKLTNATKGIYFKTDTAGNFGIEGHESWGYSKHLLTILYDSRWVGLGTANPEAMLHVNGDLYASDGIRSGSYITALSTSTTSDMRMKEALQDIEVTAAQIAAAPSIRFRWKGRQDTGIGSSAQYWQQLLPDAIHTTGGHLSMEYGNIALVAVINLAREVLALNDKIRRLEHE